MGALLAGSLWSFIGNDCSDALSDVSASGGAGCQYNNLFDELAYKSFSRHGGLIIESWLSRVGGPEQRHKRT